MEKMFQAGIPGGDEIHVTVSFLDNGHISKTQWKVTGGLELIEAAKKVKSQLVGDYKQVPLPLGESFSQLLLKELLLKVKGEWPTDNELELCHCRNVPFKIVERAILLGANTVEKVRQRTSANTGCGTCLPDVERLLKLYLK